MEQQPRDSPKPVRVTPLWKAGPGSLMLPSPGREGCRFYSWETYSRLSRVRVVTRSLPSEDLWKQEVSIKGVPGPVSAFYSKQRAVNRPFNRGSDNWWIFLWWRGEPRGVGLLLAALCSVYLWGGACGWEEQGEWAHRDAKQRKQWGYFPAQVLWRYMWSEYPLIMPCFICVKGFRCVQSSQLRSVS